MPTLLSLVYAVMQVGIEVERLSKPLVQDRGVSKPIGLVSCRY